MNTRTLRPLALLLAVAAAACDNPADAGSGGPTPAQPKPLATLQVSPGEAVIVEGWMEQLEVAFLAADGTALAARPVTWISSDTTVAVVSATGEVRTRGVGTAIVTAAAEGKTGSAEIEVEARRVASLRVSQYQIALGFRQTAYVGATATAQDGQWIDVPITWTTSDSTIVAVEGNGRLTGMGAGSASVKAHAGGQVAEVYVSSTGPVLSGSWSLQVTELQGGGAVCSVSGTQLGLTLQNTWVQGGNQAWSNPTVVCQGVEGAPATPPAAPAGTVNGWLNGASLTLYFQQSGWQLSGTFTAADRIEGTAAYQVMVDGQVESRTGRFVLRRG